MIGKRSSRKHSGKQHEYWQSYSDMMAALVLMFILIMVFTLAQSIEAYEEKIQIQEEQAVALAGQQALLEEQQEKMQEQQEQLDEIVGIKVQIINELNKTFKNSDLSIELDDQTGAISMDSNVLFALDSSTLSAEGVAFLEDFLPLYISVLLDSEYSEYVSEIIIEGHTDTQGSYMYNLNLSQERAYSVASYCLDEESEIFTQEEVAVLRDIVTANGRSYSNPVYTEDGEVDADKSRRVDIKFRLKDDEMIRQMQLLLEDSDL